MTKSFCDVCNTDQTVKTVSVYVGTIDPFTFSPSYYGGSVSMPKNIFAKDLCEKCYDQFLKKITDIIQKVGELS